MRILTDGFDLDDFFRRVTRVRGGCLLLDYDGTLAPFTEDRDKAFPYPGVRSLLNRIIESGRSRLILISGRALRDLTPLLGLKHPAEMWGSHGRERLTPDGVYAAAELSASSAQGIEDAKAWIAEAELSDRCEEKPAGLALHTRGLDPNAAEKIHFRVERRLGIIAEEKGLALHRFDGGVELRVPGVNKGNAVKTVLNEMGNDRPTAYLGDDLTDEDAFKAVKGRGVGALVRPEFRPTAADVWLKPPDELIDFLDRWLVASGGTHG